MVGSVTIPKVKIMIATQQTNKATTHKSKLIDQILGNTLVNIFEGILGCVVHPAVGKHDSF